MSHPSFADAARFWIKLGFISFGGPAGQIAIMHREVVQRRGWLSERDFANSLNFCMLLPGPEALQLAIYLGWRLHGTRGGLVAGIAFITPSIVLLLGLSYAYAAYGEIRWVAAALLGLQATVVALILRALLGLGRRALGRPLWRVLALLAFVALYAFNIGFPWVLGAAALAGALLWREAGLPATASAAPSFPWRTLVVGALLWLAPLILLWATADAHPLLARVYVFFTQVALVTFGGAYAVLAYVNAQVVDVFGWLTAAQTVAGLGLAESTPGPLVIVLQFVGFMAGWNQPGPLDPLAAATIAALLAAWATFLPSFVFIFLGAPYVERIVANGRLAGALSGITAAVVGVIASLALVFGKAVLLPTGLGAPAWAAIVIAATAFALLSARRVEAAWVVAGGAAAGLLLSAAGL